MNERTLIKFFLSLSRSTPSFLSKEVFRQEAIIFKLCRTYVLSQRHDCANAKDAEAAVVAVAVSVNAMCCVENGFERHWNYSRVYAHATERNTSNCINLSIVFHAPAE